MLNWPDIPAGLRPSHAYVPGKSPRHPEDWFDNIKATVSAEVPPERLHETLAFQTGLAYFGAGFFWECHEVLEAVWMSAPDPSAEREVVQALIQLANARLKLVMGKPNAAFRLCDMVEGHLSRCPTDGATLGVRIDDLRKELAAVSKELKL